MPVIPRACDRPSGLYTAPSGSTGTLAAVTAAILSGSVSGTTLAYVLSSAWSTQDIGGVAIAGAAGDNGGGTFGLVGSGIGLVDVNNDSFRYAYQSWTGDSVLVARVASQQRHRRQSVRPGGVGRGRFGNVDPTFAGSVALELADNRANAASRARSRQRPSWESPSSGT